MPYFCSWELMDLFLLVNEAKRNKLEKEMVPEQVIPIDTCRIALTVRKKGMPIFSFNTDFEYFCLLPYRPKPYIEYWKPENFLNTLHP